MKYYLRLIITAVILQFSLTSYSQNTITGLVKSSDDDQIMPGVSIKIQGKMVGTLTDSEGKFSLKATPNDKIVISMVGYKTAIKSIGDRNFIAVILDSDNTELAGVVVLGYSEKLRKEVSASVVTLDTKQLQNVASTDIQSMLQGKVAGLLVNSPSGAPGVAAEMRIRGINSINVDRPPLIVVDGIIGGNYVPNDVESISVLKDAAAIGLYGASGSGGVIIVNTKQAILSKTIYSFSSKTGIREASTGNFSLQNSQTLYETHKKMWGNDVVNFLRNRPEDLKNVNYDWLGDAFGKAIFQNYNFSLRGNPSGKTAYNLSVDYVNEEGTFKKTSFDRFNLHSNVKFTPSDRFQITNDINLQYTSNKTYFFDWIYDSFLYLPWDSPYGSDGNPQYVDATTPTEWYSRDRRNFLHSQSFSTAGSSGIDAIYSLRASYKITDWLKFETRNRLSANYGRYDEFISPETREGKSIKGSVSASTYEGRGIISTNLLRYSFGKKESIIDGFVGYEGGTYFTNSLGFAGRNLPQGIKIPGAASQLISGSGSNLTTNGQSVIGEINYSKNRKYFATVNMRMDGSSLFAPNKRYAYFPSGSVAWLVSEEEFLQDKGIGLLKLRASYGYVGNDGFSSGSNGLIPFGYLATYNVTGQYNQSPAAIPDNPSNNNLGWETSKILNFGVDVELLKNQLSFNLDVYNKNVDGMLFRNPLSFSSGFEYRWENIGAMNNSGIELGLNFNKKIGDFTYNGNFNISFNQNNITKITDVTDRQLVGSEIRQINEKGKSAFVWYMPKWKGVDTKTGGPLWEYLVTDNGGNVISTRDTSNYNAAQAQPISGALPKWSGGFSNTFTYKNLSLNFLISFQGGNTIYNRSRMFFDSDGTYTQYAMMNLQSDWSRWENPGDVATHPKLERNNTSLSNAVSSRYLEKGDYVRLRNVRVAYSMPGKVLKRLKLSDLIIYVNADNLFTLTKFSGMDPDINLNLQPFAVPGTSDFKYPINKQYTLGVNLNF